MAFNGGKGALYEINGDIYPVDYFNRRVKEEKQRTDRTGKPFSLLLVDFHNSLEINGTWKFLNGRLTNEICRCVIEAKRCTDLVGWYESNRLAVLLPDTDGPGACVLAGKIRNNLDKLLSRYSKFKDLIRDKVILTYSTYPDYLIQEKSKQQPESDCKPSDTSEEPKNTEYMDRHKYYRKNGNGGKWKPGFILLRPVQGVVEMDPVLVPIFTSQRIGLTLSKGIKRLMDVVGAIVGLVIFSPVMLLSAILIRLTSKGSILFKQERLGYLGRKFTFLKFRSMYQDVDQEIHEEYITNFIKNNGNDNPREERMITYKMKDDYRITPIGKILRKTSLDELPQLFNVLKGDMSLVGPRPPIQYEVDKYKLWHRKRVLEVKPGITGLWQVSGRSSTTFEDMVRQDLHYAIHWSIAMDIAILIKTVKAVVTMKGAY